MGDGKVNQKVKKKGIRKFWEKENLGEEREDE